ncbi:orotidine-5'-phosphate decarboxylase [Salirhabdus euzebyi]|uniref:Orotidine 5'-phosphate decarboxylase n=2 Tax=Salirhabdus euzebyi TaxID=394506 RepID=A0A841Q3M0_9BACI|nr:orotidine-5'-phosphate decarboxylase [Salirhabdus euzebyi]
MRPLYVALDFPTFQEASLFLEKNNLKGVHVKVGMELFYREGMQAIERLKDNGYSIFLDLKLHDIPNTVKSAMRNLASVGVDLVNIHAAGGSKMIAAAREGLEIGRNKKEPRPLLLAVTQLTSTDENMLKNELGIAWNLEETVRNYAVLSEKAGADGVVCSVHEVAMIKEACGKSFYTCTPGIRFEGDQIGDQTRVATPAYANEQGSDAIVMGRSITRANNPKQQYDKALGEWNNG